MSTIPALTVGAPAQPQTTQMPVGSLYTPYLTLVLPNTTIVSALAPRPTVAPANAGIPPVTEEEAAEHSKHDGQRPQTSDAGGNAGQRIDLERLKFRLVFILWPALVGITMAL